MTKDDLQKFCAGADDLRYYLQAPWSRDKWSYATNGHIIVRVPRLADVAEEPKAPDAEKLLKKTTITKWMPVPACAMPEDVDCWCCEGTGRMDGGACVECNHTGKVHGFGNIDVGDTVFAQRYLAMIQGWEIAPNGLKPAWIRNGDATGLLMPVRKD